LITTNVYVVNCAGFIVLKEQSNGLMVSLLLIISIVKDVEFVGNNAIPKQ
jgi:hypothetical protein